MDNSKLYKNQLNYDNYPEPDISVDEAWASMNKLLAPSTVKVPKGKLSTYFSANFLGYVTIGLIILAVCTYYYSRVSSKKIEPVASYYSYGKPKKVTLSNGNLAFMDKNSSITEWYSKSNEREFIVKGAAFIEAKQLNKQTAHHIKLGMLAVVTTNANIYVSFDSMLAISTVHLQSGIANIEIGEQKLSLHAGESLEYNEKDKRISDKLTSNLNLFSYATRSFEFVDTQLNEVAEAIEYAYGFNIVFANKNFYKCRISTRFDNKSLKEIFDLMAFTLNFTYQIDEKNNQVIVSGEGCK